MTIAVEDQQALLVWSSGVLEAVVVVGQVAIDWVAVGSGPEPLVVVASADSRKYRALLCSSNRSSTLVSLRVRTMGVVKKSTKRVALVSLSMANVNYPSLKDGGPQFNCSTNFTRWCQ